MSYQMHAAFYPAHEPKNGFLGLANVTVAHAFRLYGIAVFANKEDEGIHIQFPGYTAKDGQEHKYFVPENKDAYAAICGVINDAVFAKDFKATVKGDFDPKFEVTSGRKVEEPYVDARYSMKIEGLGSLHGITTSSSRDGERGPFVPVDMPSLPAYEKDGKTIYPDAYRGLENKWTDKDGKEQSKDYDNLIRGLILQKRKELGLENRPTLAEQMSNAEQKAAEQAASAKEAPAPEMNR